ncbi:P-loop containing nucleoside triphosphate hydrolase protein [Lasiosphaeria hispida]|uniref:DNA 3'-5' helicase n=1 Tax=Lasiosphaeria hispida TaxID=260671 RepID=A0AAJ0HAJ0_9PEZI|nr:P-loop containing nucleoside triphosphate hydrolase protein [Lasiosphaeria hispida]
MTAFQGNQQEAIDAVIRGDSPIVHIAGTGGGKSLTFMLPAYCTPDGVTIVIVPFVALQEDLHKRCHMMSIRCEIWSTTCIQTAPIVLVTPESFSIKQFRDWDEAEFFTTLHLPRHQATIVRQYTTRHNISYIIHQAMSEEEVDKVVIQAMESRLAISPREKIILYCQRVDHTEEVAQLLGYSAYHGKVTEAKEKSQIIQQWLDHRGPIVATNALGAGIDIPDIQTTIHIGLPRSLHDFMQESGRAGRDGHTSHSVIIFTKTHTISQASRDWFKRMLIWAKKNCAVCWAVEESRDADNGRPYNGWQYKPHV